MSFGKVMRDLFALVLMLVGAATVFTMGGYSLLSGSVVSFVFTFGALLFTGLLGMFLIRRARGILSI